MLHLKIKVIIDVNRCLPSNNNKITLHKYIKKDIQNKRLPPLAQEESGVSTRLGSCGGAASLGETQEVSVRFEELEEGTLA